MKVDLFDFELPVERIALRPARPRETGLRDRNRPQRPMSARHGPQPLP